MLNKPNNALDIIFSPAPIGWTFVEPQVGHLGLFPPTETVPIILSDTSDYSGFVTFVTSLAGFNLTLHFKQ